MELVLFSELEILFLFLELLFQLISQSHFELRHIIHLHLGQSLLLLRLMLFQISLEFFKSLVVILL